MTQKILDAVYESQRDNVFDGSVTCAVTSLSMLLQSAHLYKKGDKFHPKLEDEILTDIRARYKDHKALREDFNFLAKYAKEKYGVALKYFGYNKNDWLAKFVNTEYPFMTSTSNALTSFGHIVLAKGYVTADELLLVFNDPFGEYPYKAGKTGEGVLYPASRFPFDDGKGAQKKYHTLSFV